MNGCAGSCETNGASNVTLDLAFATPIDETSVVQIGPFKGQFIFHGNRYADGGAFQTYGTAMDVIISTTTFERTEGVLTSHIATIPYAKSRYSLLYLTRSSARKGCLHGGAATGRQRSTYAPNLL